MKITKTLILVTLSVALSQSIYSQRAKDGDLTVATANNVVNAYTYLTSDASATATSITVNDNTMIGGVVFGGALAPGDLIMIIQMQGASINCNVTPAEPAPGGWGDLYTVPNQWLWTFDWYNHIEDWGAMEPNPDGGAYNNAGKFEQVEVLSVSGGNVINLQCGLQNNYTQSGHVQIVRVPRINNLTVSGGINSIIPTYWNGQSGGIVAIEVEAVLDINALSSISASGFGFRGGELDMVGNSGSTANLSEVRFLGSYSPAEGSEKGESILGFHTELDALYSRYGISGAANGGGGGGYQNCGGGGGSNIGTVAGYTGNGVPDINYAGIWALDLSHPPLAAPTALGGLLPVPWVETSPGGGRGGYALSTSDQNEAAVGPRNGSWGGDARKTNGGRGGHPLTYDATRLFFGGGGGAGDQDSFLSGGIGEGGAGGRGGGIVYITSYGTVIGDGKIEVNGAAGQKSNPNNIAPTVAIPWRGIDGAGGGGAGGSIYIENASALLGGAGNLDLEAQGGNGGNQDLSYINPLAPQEAGGPGGSGAGGSIAFNSGAPNQSLSAGVSGVTNSNHMTLFPPNGATAGATGIGSLSSKFYDIIAVDDTICSGDVANLSVSISGVLPGGTVEWYAQEFGGVSLNSGLTFTTPALFANTTYYVGVCPGTFRRAINVIVAPSQDATFTMSTTCDGGTATITGTPGGTFNFDVAPVDLAVIDANTGTVSLGTSGTTYNVEYLTPGPCPDSLVVLVTASAADDASFTMTPTCDGATATITGLAGGTFSFNTPPVDLAVIDPVTGTVSGGTPGNAYDVMYTTPLGPCQANTTQIVVASLSDDASFTMTPTCDGGTATITGMAGGTFSFNTPPIDLAVIDPVTGTVSAGTTGNTYDVMYTTPVGPCQSSSTQMVTAATDLAYTVTITDENCGSLNGIIDLVASGGDLGPYQYSITGGAPYFASGTFNGLAAGLYNISILDLSGCEITSTESVSTIGGPSISSITPTDPTCAGACDGSITVVVAGGTPPYSYQWYDVLMNPVGIDDPTLGPVCAGDYSVEVTDASGALVYYFNENFGVDVVTCTSQGTVAAGYNSGAGAWTTTATGVNDPEANLWFVSTMEEGVGAGNCGDGCGVGPGPYFDRTLHLSNAAVPAVALIADQGAAYNAGGGCPFLFCVATDVRVESPAINLAGTGMTLTFDYIHESDGTDQCELLYFDGAIWNSLGILPNSVTGACAPQHTWAQYSWPIPVPLEGLVNFQLGFRWFNNDDGVGTDPSVAIDNIQISEVGPGCPSFANSTLTDPTAPILIITDPASVCAPSTVDLTAAAVTVGSDAGVLTYWTDALATVPLVGPTVVGVTGVYYIQLDVAGCTSVEAVNVVINPAPNLVITDPAAVCSPGTVDLTAPAVTAGSDAGALTYWTDLAATIPLVGPAAIGVTGTYYIQLDAAGCTSVEAVNVVINPLPSLVITDPAAVCSPGTVDLTAPAVTAGSDAGALSYWTDLAATIPLVGPAAVGVTGTYYIQLVDGNTCSVVQPVNVVINPLPSFVISGSTDPTVCGLSDGTYTISGLTALTAYSLAYLDDGVPVGPLAIVTDALGDFVVTGLNAGSYSNITVSDGVCAFVAGPVTLTDPLAPSFTLIFTDPSTCGGNDGSITIQGLNASTGYNLTYSDDAIQVGPAAIVTDAFGDYLISGLNAGSYTNFSVDLLGCIGSNPGPVTLTGPLAPVLVITDPAAVCAPGTVDITAPAVTAGSDAGALSYWTDLAATIPLVGPSAVGVTGTYYIQLDVAGCTSVEAVNVVINPTPNLVITDPAAVCSPGTADLTAPAVTAGSDAGALSYWTDLAATTPLVGPAAIGVTGTYYIELDVAGCTSVEPVNVVISSLDDPSFSMTPTCDGGTATILGTPGGVFTFNIPPADAAIIDALTGTVTGGTPGSMYDVLYTTSGTCPANSSFLLNTSLGDDASFNYNAAAYCTNTIDPTPTITGLAGGTFSSLPAGLSINTSTGVIDVSTSTPGLYTVTYTTNGACPASSNETVTINLIPAVVVTNSGPVCLGAPLTTNETGGDAVSWIWSSNGAATITNPTDQTPAITSAVDGELFTVIVTDVNGCTNGASTTVSIITQPILDPINDVVNCGSYSLPAITGTNLTGNEEYYNDSQLNGGTIISGAVTTSQTVWVFDGSGSCTDELSFNVTIDSLPMLTNISGGAGYCVGDVVADILVDVTGTPNWTVNYTLDGTPQSVVSGTSPISLGNTVGVYVLVDVVDANCTNSISGTQTITVDPIPAAPNAGSDTSYCVNSPFDNMVASGSGGQLTWYSDAALTSVLGVGGTLMPSSVIGSTVYYVTEGAGSCEGAPALVTITIDACDITIPTAFTPDGDMVNDTWEIIDLDNTYPDNRVTIYNRWGNLIFEHNSTASNPYSSNQWDGMYKGNLLPVASYFFIIEYNDGTSNSTNGSVSIIVNK